MVVITLTDCPPKVRGDLSKWLLEISPGVYVGHVSKRVRENLWNRICRNLTHGRACLVYSTNGEQRLGFECFGSTWEPVDYDGIKLIRRPNIGHLSNPSVKEGYSKAAQLEKAKQITKHRNQIKDEYIAIDIETTGLDPMKDEIIEVAAILVVNDQVVDEFSSLIATNKIIPQQIVELTGITDVELKENGKERKKILHELKDFIGNRKLVGHNLIFDLKFLKQAFIEEKITFNISQFEDTMKIAKKKRIHVQDYTLEELSSYFRINRTLHRALDDCLTTYEIYTELKKL